MWGTRGEKRGSKDPPLQRRVEERCGKVKMGWNGVLTNSTQMLFLVGSMDATLLDREANRSLTTDTMCQNLFETI